MAGFSGETLRPQVRNPAPVVGRYSGQCMPAAVRIVTLSGVFHAACGKGLPIAHDAKRGAEEIAWGRYLMPVGEAGAALCSMAQPEPERRIEEASQRDDSAVCA